MTLAAFTAAWLLHLLAAVSPGPAVLMAVRTGVTEGSRTGAWLAIGIGLGAVVWAAAALFGLAVLFQAAPRLLLGKLAGGLFLIRMALQMWRNATGPLDMSHDGTPPRRAFSALRLGIFTRLSNPKPAVFFGPVFFGAVFFGPVFFGAVFFGAVFIGTVPPGTTMPWIALLLVAVFVNEVVCNIAVARAYSCDGPHRTYRRLKTAIDRSFSGVLAALNVKVAQQ